MIKKYFSAGTAAFKDIRANIFGQIFPLKPKVINLFINDICNSRCQMCLVWKNNKDKEISPDELTAILNDSLFSAIEYIGVNGGEPTLRADLPEIFKVICSKKPKIKGANIITNAIQEDVVKKQVLECYDICKAHRINFEVMISLDGLGAMHDTVRGCKGSFDSALRLLRYFHNRTSIPASFGCTITKTNAWCVDELLDYVKEEGLYGRFRIAEFINRLNNQEQKEFIRSFDERMKYHLGLFFFRLEHDFETNPVIRKTYKNIRTMLAEDKPRQIGCQYQTEAICLTSRGDLLYCSPKSLVIGNALQTPPKEIYFSNIHKRKEIIRNYCSQCIHDYHEPLTFREQLFSLSENRARRKTYDCDKLIMLASKVSKKKSIPDLSKLRSRKILIVGWYGTETAGDKATLWTIVKRLMSREAPPEQIYLSSLFPFISKWTVKEMAFDNVSVVETYAKEFEKICDDADEIVVGGGPLMDIPQLNHILYAFIRGSKSNAVTRIEGCGIGPLVLPRYVKVVSEILRLSDHINLRDNNSLERCQREFKYKAEMGGEPAVNYVEFIKSSLNQEKNNSLSCFLREWTREYIGGLSDSQFQSVKHNFELQLLLFIKAAASGRNIRLFAMHTFHVGGDDRIFNRRIARHIPSGAVKEPLSPSEIIQNMYSSQLNICMRYHSVVFAETLGVPYIAIDYTNAGKIKFFLEEKGRLDRLITLHDIASGKWRWENQGYNTNYLDRGS